MMRIRILIVLALLFVPASTYAADVVTITMTDAGFSPVEVTIPANTTVQFINAGDFQHWPASNIHPTHSAYPGSGIEKCGTANSTEAFDACAAVPKGERYEFTFTHSGVWRFHDHLHPVLTGSIVVTGTEKTTVQNTSSIWKRSWDVVRAFGRRVKRALALGRPRDEVAQLDMFALVKNHTALVDAVRDFGGKALMQRLIAQSQGGSTQDCHQEAHKLGRAAYEIAGKRAFGEGDSACHSGFYHGAMESFLREQGTVNLAASIREVCDSFPTSFSRFECLHGVGHGLLAYEDYDLPTTLDTCKELKDDFSISSCYGGAFMENIVTAQGFGATVDHTTTWVKRDDSQFPCTSFTNDFQRLYQCYLMQTSWMLTISNYDFDWAAAQCLKAPPSMIDTCYQSLGRDAAGFTLRDPERIMTICNKVQEDRRTRCVIGAVNVIVDFWGEKLVGQASELCARAGDSRDVCFSTLSGRLPELFPDKESRLRACDTLDIDYQKVCK